MNLARPTPRSVVTIAALLLAAPMRSQKPTDPAVEAASHQRMLHTLKDIAVRSVFQSFWRSVGRTTMSPGSTT